MSKFDYKDPGQDPEYCDSLSPIEDEDMYESLSVIKSTTGLEIQILIPKDASEDERRQIAKELRALASDVDKRASDSVN